MIPLGGRAHGPERGGIATGGPVFRAGGWGKRAPSVAMPPRPWSPQTTYRQAPRGRALRSSCKETFDVPKQGIADTHHLASEMLRGSPSRSPAAGGPAGAMTADVRRPVARTCMSASTCLACPSADRPPSPRAVASATGERGGGGALQARNERWASTRPPGPSSTIFQTQASATAVACSNARTPQDGGKGGRV